MITVELSRFLIFIFISSLAFGGEVRDTFTLGCNLPWLDGRMGWDVAYKPEWGCGFDEAKVDRYFADMHRMGVKVVRWWLLADMRGGVIFDEDGYPTGVYPELFEHMDYVMDRICPKYGIRIYWCLLSGLLNTDHFNMVVDEKARRVYIQNVLIPIARRYGDHPYLFAFDLMNEPESDVKGPSGNWSLRGTDWNTMREFLGECADAIHRVAPRAKVSVGSGWHGWENVAKGKYKGLGLDFYDFHIYTDSTYLPPVKSLKLDKPCLIGEYNVREETKDEERQAELVGRFLREAREKGYMGVLIWSYDHPESKSPHALLRPDGSWKRVAWEIKRLSGE
ncbi:cellulase family glycosylhydrolase [Candidatus Poribacteria bacterium]|nr:cellulase family glycosylhydrolase [Candidatus Poribacteria bacterium]